MAASSRTPHQRAAACFALARSTTHDGERAAAIGRGDAICRRYGLDPGAFDVPGRQAAARGAAAARFTEAEIRRAWADAGAAPDEDLETARRRNFHAEAARAKERDARRQLRLRAREASLRLFELGVCAYPAEASATKSWVVFHGNTSIEMSHEELIELDRACAAHMVPRDAHQHAKAAR